MSVKLTNTGLRRPVKFVEDPDTGEAVYGLRLHGPSGRFYRIEDGSRVYYRPNGLMGVAYLRRAVMLHQQWLRQEVQDGKMTLKAPLPVDANPAEVFATQTPFYLTGDANLDPEGKNLTAVYTVDRAAYLAQLREELLDPIKRRQLAAELGIPEIAYLHRLTPSAGSLTLEHIGNQYLNREPKLEHRSRLEAIRFWTEFRRIVGVQRVSELNAEHIQAYRDHVLKDMQTPKESGEAKSTRYFKNRRTVIAAIFNYALTQNVDMDNLSAAKQLLSCLSNKAVRLRKPKVNPQPISKQDVEKLLTEENLLKKAVVLFCLNIGGYPIDAAKLEKEDLRDDLRYYVTDRTKTQVTRIAVLWESTRSALRAYMEAFPNTSEYVFLNEEGIRSPKNPLPTVWVKF